MKSQYIYIFRERHKNYKRKLKQYPERINIIYKSYIQHSSKKNASEKKKEIWILCLKMGDSRYTRQNNLVKGLRFVRIQKRSEILHYLINYCYY